MTTETVDLAPINARMEEHTAEIREVRNQIANIIAGAPAVVPPMTLHAAFATILKMVADDPGQNRALADVIGTSPGNASGLIRDAWNTELIGYVERSPPSVQCSRYCRVPVVRVWDRLPEDHHPHPGGEDGPLRKRKRRPGKLIVASVTFTMEWFAGAVDVSLELISQSDPSVLEVVASI